MIMPTQTVNLDKVEKQLAELLAFAEDNGEIVIAQNGKPLARLEPVKQPKKKKRIAGLNRGTIWTSEDFDEPLPDKFWLGKE
jgi:prevent-host-death family protein